MKHSELPVEELTEAQASEELARLSEQLAQANTAYFTLDAPDIDDVLDADGQAVQSSDAATHSFQLVQRFKFLFIPKPFHHFHN